MSYIDVKDPAVRLRLYKEFLRWYKKRPNYCKKDGLCFILREMGAHIKGKYIDPEEDLPEMLERRTTHWANAYLWRNTEERIDALTDAIKEMEELKEKGELK